MLGKLTVAAALTAALLAPADSAADGLDRFRWQNRPLLVFAPAAHHTAYQRQFATAERHAAGFAARDMVLIAAVADQPVRVDGVPANDLKAADLRRRFQVPEARFAAILVGKDGTEKLRRTDTISAETLFDTIDAMPMRRREMRRQGDD